MLQHYLTGYALTRSLLELLHDPLHDWRAQLSKPVETLYPELLRYADVVCGTCSDIAATQALGDSGHGLALQMLQLHRTPLVKRFHDAPHVAGERAVPAGP